MNKKSKKTLKNAFNIPEPIRKDEFLNSLPIKQKKSFSFNIPLYISTAVTAVVIIGIWGGIKNLPHFEQPDNMDNSVYSESTSSANHTEKTSVQTTTISSAEKNITVTSYVSTVKTSGIGTVSRTQNTETTVSVQTTIKTETIRKETTTTTTKESNNISYKPTTEIRTTEKTSVPDTELTKTTKKTTTATQTTTKTTTMSHTTTATTTKTFYTNTYPAITTTTEGELNHVTTTTTPPIENPGNTAGASPQTTTTTLEDVPLQTITTTYDNGACETPYHDFTVTPAVRYYPDGEIYITDSESNDVMPPATPQEQATEIFREMAENSDLIAIVAVDEIIYTGFDGKPYTQENAIVTDVIYGDITVNSRISIYCKGGYIPVSEYSPDGYIDNSIEDNVTVLDYAGNKKFSQVGDSYMCFLKKSDGTFPDGSYHLTGLNDISKFTFSGDDFVNLNNNQSLTLSQIQSFLNQ